VLATNIAVTVSYVVTGDYVSEDRPKGDKSSSTAVGV
jgi:hypothetical protein